MRRPEYTRPASGMDGTPDAGTPCRLHAGPEQRGQAPETGLDEIAAAAFAEDREDRVFHRVGVERALRASLLGQQSQRQRRIDRARRLGAQQLQRDLAHLPGSSIDTGVRQKPQAASAAISTGAPQFAQLICRMCCRSSAISFAVRLRTKFFARRNWKNVVKRPCPSGSGSTRSAWCAACRSPGRAFAGSARTRAAPPAAHARSSRAPGCA